MLWLTTQGCLIGRCGGTPGGSGSNSSPGLLNWSLCRVSPDTKNMHIKSIGDSKLQSPVMALESKVPPGVNCELDGVCPGGIPVSTPSNPDGD